MTLLEWLVCAHIYTAAKENGIINAYVGVRPEFKVALSEVGITLRSAPIARDFRAMSLDLRSPYNPGAFKRVYAVSQLLGLKDTLGLGFL
jgi:hypothetical protein